MFELTPAAGGSWTEQVLHSFGNGTDGASPYAGLIFDAAGNLYGTTYHGGSLRRRDGVRVDAHSGRNWTEKVLHSFGNGTDGANPYAGLIFDAAGNLYGTTTRAALTTSGTVFEITPMPPVALQFVPLSQPCRAVDTRPTRTAAARFKAARIQELSHFRRGRLRDSADRSGSIP